MASRLLSPLRRPFCPPLAIAAAMGSAPMSKIRHKLRNLLRPWGPCPYHLPPRNQSPWTPLRAPLYPPPPHRESFKKRDFSCFCTALETSKIRRKLRNLLRPWGPCPYHLPPRHRSPWRPPEHRAPLATLSNQAPTLYPPELWGPTTYPPRTEALGPPSPSPCTLPHPTGHPSWRAIFLLFVHWGRRRCDTGCEICSVPGARAPTTYPPGTKALGPPSPSPCTLPHPTGHPSKHAIFLLFVRVRNVKNTTQVAKFVPSLGPVPLPPTYPPPPHRESFKKRLLYPLSRPNNIGHPLPLFRAPAFIYPLSTKPALGPCPYHLPPQNRSPWTPLPSRHKLRNLLCPWGSCPYHLPPRNQSPWTPLRAPLYPPPPHRASFKTRHFRQKHDASCEICSVPGARAPTTYPPGTKALGPPSATPCTLPHPTGNPSKNAIFLFFVRIRNVKNTTQVAKFAPSLGPVPLPPTPPAPKPLETPRAPDLGPRGIGHPLPLFRTKPSLLAPALVYPPVHQASSGAVPLLGGPPWL